MAATFADAATTPWRQGRFDGRSGSPRLLFGRMFEDPSIERSLFPDRGHVLCIASAGDTARSLAATGRSVLAVDVNPAQLAEVGRRLAGGPARRGSADRLLAIGRGALVPLGWHRARLERFCALDDPEAQRAEWQRLVTPAVRWAIDTALAPRVLRLAYGAEFAGLVPPGFGGRLVDRVGRRAAVSPNRDNPWLALLLTGSWPAADPEGGADRIDLVEGEVASVLEALPSASLDGISLSNVLDGPGAAYRARLLAAAHRVARPGAPIIVRSFLDAGDVAARRLAAADRSLLWGTIDVHRARRW